MRAAHLAFNREDEVRRAVCRARPARSRVRSGGAARLRAPVRRLRVRRTGRKDQRRHRGRAREVFLPRRAGRGRERPLPRSLHHKAFDLGAIAISDDHRVLVSRDFRVGGEWEARGAESGSQLLLSPWAIRSSGTQTAATHRFSLSVSERIMKGRRGCRRFRRVAVSRKIRELRVALTHRQAPAGMGMVTG